ncbi:MAG: RHS repeat domain-containing protein [Terriglobales bacterium]
MSQQATYNYDSNGRLTSVSFSNGFQIAYNYDSVGNRTTVATVSGNIVLNGFRFSLSSTDPAPTSDTLAATTGYLVPYTSDAITLAASDGSLFTDSTNGASLSLSFSAFTAGNVYRIFLSDPTASGSPTLSATQWTNSSTPGASLALTPATPGGFLVLSSDHTKRYIGDVYCTANGQVNDAAKDRGVFNQSNKVLRVCAAIDNAAAWSVASAAVQTRNHNTTEGVGRFGLMLGESPEAMDVNMQGYGHGSGTGTNYGMGFGVDITNNFTRVGLVTGVAATIDTALRANFIYQPATGRHFFQAMESGASGGSFSLKSGFAIDATILEALVKI